MATLWLILTSLFFYGWWNPVYLILLVSSILVNFWFGARLAQKPDKILLIAGVTFNLALLGYFKYAGFFVSTVAALTGSGWQIEAIVLPLTISFSLFNKLPFSLTPTAVSLLKAIFRRSAYSLRFPLSLSPGR